MRTSNEEFRGTSPAMRELSAQVGALGPAPLDVLIEGETGTGKELTARAIHDASRRRGPFVVLDSGALSPSLAEATIFGVRKGAFTGADRDQVGVFEAANQGTLFIDEVGELPLDLQVKFLRALDNREVNRLGEPGQQRRVDVRVVAATHRDLRRTVAAGEFREDLYYRLARAVIRTPPLRERGDDIVALAEFFLDNSCREYGLTLSLSREAVAAIRRHTWPGNVRELRNVIEEAAHRTRSGEIAAQSLRIGPEPGFGGITGLTVQPRALGVTGTQNYRQVHADVDRWLLPEVLEASAGNLSQAARSLGISRDTLRSRLRELGIYAP
jgi:DNA-binding NtrC family response regulator